MMLGGYINYEGARWVARMGAAQMTTILFLLLSIVSFSLPYTESVRPLFIIIPIYYWGIYRPSLIPAVLVFVLGLIVDFISGFPVGLHAALFVVVHVIMRSQRLFLMGQPYLMFWLGFTVISTGVYMAQWFFFSLRYLSLMPVTDILASNLLTILMFPLMALVLTFIQRILPPNLKSY